MIVTQTDVIPVTLAESTVLTIRETNTYTRVLSFKNLTASQLSIKVQESADGGVTWTDVVNSFNLAAGAIVGKVVSSTDLMRVRASGASDSAGLLVSYTRMYLDAQYIWTSPVV